MISSTVIALGGDVSSGPSCAEAGRTANLQPRSMAIKSVMGDHAMRNDHFILLVYRNMVRRAGRQTAARLPPTPLRSAKPEDRALQFCRYLRCQTRIGVAVEEHQQRPASARHFRGWREMRALSAGARFSIQKGKTQL